MAVQRGNVASINESISKSLDEQVLFLFSFDQTCDKPKYNQYIIEKKIAHRKKGTEAFYDLSIIHVDATSDHVAMINFTFLDPSNNTTHM